MAIARINEFYAAPGKSQELHDLLLSLLDYIGSSKGNISVEVLRNEEKEDHFIVMEKWESKEDHKLSVESFPKDDMMKAMPLMAAPPKGEYYTVS